MMLSNECFVFNVVNYLTEVLCKIELKSVPQILSYGKEGLVSLITNFLEKFSIYHHYL